MQMSSEDCKFNLKDKIEEIEFEIIRKAMETSGGVKEKAARMLGLNRTTLIEKLKRYEKNRKK
jgi:Response regulator containing CheY-like receiver, AAA-type ATPase, and DNA-binding domains